VRQLFLFLLFINVAFFYWQYQKQDRPVVQLEKEAVEDSTVRKLVLLSELSEQSDTEQAPQPEGEPQAESDSEQQLEAAQEPNQIQKQQQFTEEEEKPVLTCYTLGPVSGSRSAGALSSMLEKAGVTANTRETENRIPNGFWVHLPVVNDANSAQRLLQEIQDRNISDVSTVPRDEGGYVVSLGVFSEEFRAKRRQSQFVKMGYAPLIEVRYRTRILTWFDVKDSESTLLVPDVFKDLAAKFPGIKMQEIDC
jgi:hypothetical protein